MTSKKVNSVLKREGGREGGIRDSVGGMERLCKVSVSLENVTRHVAEDQWGEERRRGAMALLHTQAL